ncbi:MAG: hypothetical protein J0H82_26115 [Alphaproteobacteria bacterium]|jgi:hypothetical protein|nr:hypothetical protein [Alphaproteobacteria bacterium]
MTWPKADPLDRRLADELAKLLPDLGKTPDTLVAWKQSITRGAIRYRLQLNAAPKFGGDR